MKRLLCSFLLIAMSAFTSFAPTNGYSQPFKTGEKVIVMGDSITHNGLYHAFIYLFYQTRYPDTRIEIVNAGVSGGRTTDGAARLDEDVLARDPDVVMINLGMNDVGTSQFTQEDQEAAAEMTERFLQRYKDNLTEIVTRIQAHDSNIRIILVSPSPYDQTGTQERESAVGKNDAIRDVTQFMGEFAEEAGVEFVDFHTPMTRFNAEGQIGDPDFTIIGQDRVHPGPMGHLIMAYYILRGQGVDPVVSEVLLVIEGERAEVESATKAEVSNLSFKNGGIHFDLLAEVLPYPVEDSARKAGEATARGALDIIPFQDTINREIIKIKGLSAERYELAIEGEPVGIYSSEELAAGVNLAGNDLTPQFQQANKIALLNDQRWDLERPLRGPAWIKYKVIWEGEIDPADSEASAAYLQKWRDGLAHRDYRDAYYRYYIEFSDPDAYAEREAKLAEIVEEIYSSNRPHKLSYSLTPTSQKALAAPEKLEGANKGLDSFVPLLEFEELRGWSGLEPTTENVKSGQFAGLWADTVSVDRIRCREFPQDLSAFNTMRVWVHSNKATRAKFAIVFRQENEATDGPDYEMTKVDVDWTGWKQLEVPFNSLAAVREPKGMGAVTECLMASSGYGCGAPDPETVLTFDHMEFLALE